MPSDTGQRATGDFAISRLGVRPPSNPGRALRAHKLFEGVIESYKLGGESIGDKIDGKEAMEIIKRVLEEVKDD